MHKPITVSIAQKSKIKRKNSAKYIYCPATHQRVQSINWRHINISNGQVMWWQCPACEGWHVIIDQNKREKQLS